jgi:hypothetical protein
MSKTKNPNLLARVLEVMPVGVAVTPEAIEAHANGGPYSSKWMLYLRMRGFDITVQKEGRKVVSYTLIKEPADAAEQRKGKEKAAPKVKAPKAAKPKKVKAAKQAKAPAAPATGNMAKLKAALKKRKQAEDVVNEFAALESVGLGIPSSTNVDNDFDAYEGNVRDLIV